MIALDIFLGFIFVTLIIMSAAGNFLVCVAIFFDRKLRRQRENLFLISLAVSDLLVGVLVMIFAASNDLLRFWPFGQVYCTMWMYFDVTLCTASILNMSAIAVDRYAHISNPLKYQGWVRRSRICWIIVVLWFISALTGSIQLVATKVLPNYNVSRNTSALALLKVPVGIIGDQRPRCELEFSVFTGVVSSSLSFFIPASFMLFAYYKLYRCARRHLRSIKGQIRAVTESLIAQSKRLSCPAATVAEDASTLASEQKARLTLGVIMGVFLLCWLPFFIVNVIRALYPDLIPQWLFVCVTWLGYANSTANPIIYSIFNRDFRNAFRNILKMICGRSGTKLPKLDFETSYSPFRGNSNKFTAASRHPHRHSNNHHHHSNNSPNNTNNNNNGDGPNSGHLLFPKKKDHWREYNSMSNLERQTSYGTLMVTQTTTTTTPALQNDDKMVMNQSLLHRNNAVSMSNRINEQSNRPQQPGTAFDNSVILDSIKKTSKSATSHQTASASASALPLLRSSTKPISPTPRPNLLNPPHHRQEQQQADPVAGALLMKKESCDNTTKRVAPYALKPSRPLSPSPSCPSQTKATKIGHQTTKKTEKNDEDFLLLLRPTILTIKKERPLSDKAAKESPLPLVQPFSKDDSQGSFMQTKKNTLHHQQPQMMNTLNIILSEHQKQQLTPTPRRRSKSDNNVVAVGIVGVLGEPSDTIGDYSTMESLGTIGDHSMVEPLGTIRDHSMVQPNKNDPHTSAFSHHSTEATHYSSGSFEFIDEKTDESVPILSLKLADKKKGGAEMPLVPQTMCKRLLLTDEMEL